MAIEFGSDISLPRTPTDAGHAVPKQYVDGVVGDLSQLKTMNRSSIAAAVNEIWAVLFPPPLALQLTVAPTDSVKTFTLPFGTGELSKIQSIDWGDGSTELALAHTYADTAERVVKVKVVPGAVFTEFRFYNKTGSTILKSVDYCDIECSATSLNTFRGCLALEAVCNTVFAKCLQVTTFSQCFQSCSKITAIPSGLFDKNTAVTSFSQCFRSCTSLTAVPLGLFDKNTAVTSFSSCFYQCSGLTTIPEGLFDNNTAVTTFSQCFAVCSAVTSAVPTLWTLFTAAGVTKTNCFTGVTQAANYSSIPQAWGGP